MPAEPVASYFLQARDERRLAAALRSEAASFQVVQTTSELGALLEELRQIRALRPRFNVQRCVHRRRAPKGRFVLFLPGETDGAVELLGLCDGLVVGRATTNERHRPMRPVWALLRRCLRPELPLRLATEEDRIVATWLRREQSRCNLVDLAEPTGSGTRRGSCAATSPIRPCSPPRSTCGEGERQLGVQANGG